MGKPTLPPPTQTKDKLKKGQWTPEEDQILKDYISKHGEGRWRTLSKNAGLKRCGKSCRLRWINYLRPDVKRGRFSSLEEEMIMQLHSVLGNRWSAIAARLPGRTDNEIKNYWNTQIKKRLRETGMHPLMNGFPIFGSSLCSLAQSGMHPDQFTDGVAFSYYEDHTLLPQYIAPHFQENHQKILGNVQVQDVHNMLVPCQDYNQARNPNQELDSLMSSSSIFNEVQVADCQSSGFCFQSAFPWNTAGGTNMNNTEASTSIVVSNNHTEGGGGSHYENCSYEL